MKVKTLLLLVLILAIATASQATYKWQVGLRDSIYVLTKVCPNTEGGDHTGILDYNATTNPYAKIYLYRDEAGNNLDYACTSDWWRTYTPGMTIGADAWAPLCNVPPACTGGVPINTFNRNVWNFNAFAAGTVFGPGNFSTTSSRFAPSTTSYQGAMTFFLVVYWEAVDHSYKTVWVSRTFTVQDVSTPQDLDFNLASDWPCCIQVLMPEACTPPPATYFVPDPPVGPQAPQKACVTICKTASHTICVGPVPLIDRVPHVSVTAGCANCDNPSCTPAVGFIYDEAGAWTWTVDPAGHPAGNYYCKTITWGTGAVSGCVCINFDNILPVGFGTAAIEPGDNSVKLTWNTLSENNLDKWIVKRDNAAVYEVNATNNASGHNYSYTDDAAVNGRTYTYTLILRSGDGTESVMKTLSATPSMEAGVVTEYALRQNYPNPFNPTTKIVYDVLNTNMVTLKIYNAAGQEVTTLVNESKAGGKRYSVNFDATNLPSGLYFYNIKIGSEFSATKKMLLVK